MDTTGKIIITQSDYIPWKGYFDAIACCEYFVVYDTVQYTKRDWRNRNIIKTPNGLQWLTIPVEVKGKFYQKINEVKVADNKWNIAHWNLLQQAYKKSVHFAEVKDWLEPVYYKCNFERLTEINEYFLRAVMQYLEIETKIVRAEEFSSAGDRNERLIDICKQLGGKEYISGPAAKAYLDTAAFLKNQLTVTFFDSSNYPSYQQQGNDFVHHVSILDMLFNLGKDSRQYLKYLR